MEAYDTNEGARFGLAILDAGSPACPTRLERVVTILMDALRGV